MYFGNFYFQKINAKAFTDETLNFKQEQKD